jgi:hypothetical protein
MVDHLPNPQLNTAINKWPMVALLARVVMVVASKLLMLNGVRLPPRALETASAVTKDDFHTVMHDFTAFRFECLCSTHFA